MTALSLNAAPRKLVNGSFETPEVTLARNWQLFPEGTVPGWETTDASGNIELWEGLFGIVAPDGDQINELNSNSQANTFQNFCLADGETINWSFWHRGRSGNNETIRLDFGTQTAITVTTGTTFQQYSGSTTIIGSGNKDVTIVSVFPTNSLGNLIDDIVIGLPPLIEFLAPTNGSIEGTGDDIPRLRLNGELLAPATVDVVVTGGSATDGTDFNLIQTVVIPVGDYDGTAGTAIPINLTVSNTFDLESSENITFALANPTGGVRLADADCDGIEESTNTYTIIDDDQFADLRVTKSDTLSSYTPGLPSTYEIIVTNAGPGDVLAAQLIDDLPNGLSINGAVTCTTSLPSSCSITSGTTEPVQATLNLANGATATISIPVLYSLNPSDYIP